LILAAADKNNLDILGALLQAGANVNEQDKHGRTALHAAIDAGEIPSIKMLLENGANPEIESVHEGTAVCAALLNHEANRASLVLSLLPARPNLSAVCPSWSMTPIELATEFNLPKIVKLLLAAGSPPPRLSNLTSVESVISVNEETDDSVKIGIHLGSISRMPSPDERALAHEICSKPDALYQRFGWRSSPHHWRILNGLGRNKDPIPLSRIAYFVRGHLNTKVGSELEDGPQLLGQSYQEAVSLMIGEGLVVQVADEESLMFAATTAELSKIAKKNGIKPTTKKKILIERMIARLGILAIKQQVNVADHFRITPEGSRILKEQKMHLAETSAKLRTEMLELLEAEQFVSACHIGCWLSQIGAKNMSRHGLVNEHCFASCIARAREALDTPIPSELQSIGTTVKRMLFISAAVSLLGNQDDHWSHWDSTLGEFFSPDGDPIRPSGFRNILSIGLDE
jgi:hypothetical protein